MNKKRLGRKAQAVIIGYVLLIVLAIVISIIVYKQLKSFVPQEEDKCPDGISLAIDEYNYDGSSTLKIKLKNSGRFNVDGAIIKGSRGSDVGIVELADNKFDNALASGDSSDTLNLNTKNKNLILEENWYGWANNSQLAWIVNVEKGEGSVDNQILCYGNKWYITFNQTNEWGSDYIKNVSLGAEVVSWKVIANPNQNPDNLYDDFIWNYTGNPPSASGTKDGKVPVTDCYWPPLNILAAWLPLTSVEIIPYIEQNGKKLICGDATIRQDLEITPE